MDTRTCIKCNETKPMTDFYERRGDCKRCNIKANTTRRNLRRDEYLVYQREYQRKHKPEKRKTRLALLAKLKKKPCTDCGGSFPPECMDFDHLDPSTKLFQVSGGGLTRNLESWMAEIEKCELVCANCHRIRTARQGRWRGR